ncbi:MFS transporter [Carnimonas nigrificans]|uniref:MFS transporter n=1 Tax=Carnimonas nigrificans TaxID=64323 RepID=UPI00046FB2DE|nr:MFS transporter [Carnimonas nigrificans]
MSSVTPPSSSSLTPPKGATRVRFGVVGLLFFATGINYLDRTNIAMTGTSLQNDLGISGVQLGWLLSAFTWSYVIATLPFGLLVDRFGTQKYYAAMVLAFSAATLIMGFATPGIVGSTALAFGVLLICRLLIGLSQAATFPAHSKIAAMWLPPQERARGIGIYSAGQYLFIALLMPVLTYIMGFAGWPSVFFITGMIGIVIGLVWWVRYREPDNQPRANEAELNYIRYRPNVDAKLAAQDAQPATRAEYLDYFTHLRFWVLVVAQFAVSSVMYFFLTWFLVYIEQVLDVSRAYLSLLSPFPYLCAAAGVFFGGTISDLLYKRGLKLVNARKLPIIVGLLVSALIVFAGALESTPIALVTLMSVCFFANALSNMCWTVLSDLTPHKLLGTVGGVFNIFSNIPGIVTPLIFGAAIDAYGNFHMALYYLGIVSVIAALVMIFGLKDLTKIRLQSKK